MAHYDELYPGRFLKATTLERPITIRIIALGGEVLEGDDGEKAKGILRYRTAGPDGQPVEGELVFCKTNAILTAAVLGTSDYKAWAGHTITIANDPTVMFGRDRVGGVRVCGSPELKKALTVEVKRPRRKKVERYTLQPTDAQGRVRAAAAPSAPAQPPPDEPRPNSPEDIGFGPEAE
jgi:hypothetical protein